LSGSANAGAVVEPVADFPKSRQPPISHPTSSVIHRIIIIINVSISNEKLPPTRGTLSYC
jgi:hypothetical protein